MWQRKVARSSYPLRERRTTCPFDPYLTIGEASSASLTSSFQTTFCASGAMSGTGAKRTEVDPSMSASGQNMPLLRCLSNVPFGFQLSESCHSAFGPKSALGDPPANALDAPMAAVEGGCCASLNRSDRRTTMAASVGERTFQV